MRNSVIEYFAACCRGASQVMLQRSILTGILFLFGILTGGWKMLLSALVSLMFVTLVSGSKRKGYTDGLWGFNALLVGCAASVFPNPNPLLLIVIIYLTIPMKHFLDRLYMRIGSSSLTLPFILATWMFIGACHLWDAWSMNLESESFDKLWISMPEIVAGLLKGLSQVFLVNSWIGGLLILAGLLSVNWKTAALALVGSALGMTCAAICGCDRVDIINGLWGFSPALTAIAVGITFRRESDICRQILITIVAIVLTFLIQLAVTPLFLLIGLPVLTLPFCLATWVIVAMESRNAATNVS